MRADNAAAIRLYEQRGYRPIGRRADYYEDGATALRYERALSTAGHGRSAAHALGRAA